MQLIVEISEDTFFDLKKKQNRTEVDCAVLDGTPLPKGHGDLIDVNRKITVTVYDEQYEEWGEETLTVREALNRWSDEGITVKDVAILADKAESEAAEEQ